MTPNSPLDKSSLVNHKLHIILSVISLGGWLPIYAAYYFFRKFTGSKINLKNFVAQLAGDLFSKTKKLKTRQKILLALAVLVIGAVGTFADDNSVTSTEVSAPTPTPTPTLGTGTSAGTVVNISDVKNNSATDGSEGWYWAASFKTNTVFLTKTDCVVKALDKNGEVIGETSYRGTTVRDGTVNGGAKSSVDSTKAKVLAIESFDVKCIIAPTPEGEATFSISISGWQVVNPASGYAIFTIRNVGEVTGEPLCRITVEDESGTYKGTGWIIGVGEIKPGAKFQSKKLLTVKKQGASYVSQSSGYCGSG